MLVGPAVVLGLALRGTLGGRDAFLATFQDDAFYYFTIARHLAQGAGSTFDGLHATNGYHPLWLLVLVPIQWVAGGSWGPIVTAAAVETLFLGIASALIYREVEPVAGPGAAFTAALAPAAWPWTAANLRCGMEGALTFFAVVVVWRCWNRARRSPPGSVRAWLAFGSACAVAFLARLEALALVVAAVVMARGAWRTRPRIALAIAGPTGMTLAIYGAVNTAFCGSPLPLSGAVKAWYAARSGLGARLGQLLEFPWPGGDVIAYLAGAGSRANDAAWPAVINGVSLLALAVAAWHVRKVWRAPAVAMGLPWLVVAAFLWTAADKAVVATVEPWNRAHVALLVSLALATGLATAPRVAGVAAAAVLALLAVAAPVSALRGPAAGDSYAPWRLAAAEWIRTEVEPGTPVGSWNAGMLGWFSGRTVVNLDGLVNDRAYFQEVIRGDGLPGYLDRLGITWLADQACRSDPTPAPYLRRLRAESLGPRVHLAMLFASDAHPDGCPGVAVWRLEPGR
jgi:hypothetical protein